MTPQEAVQILTALGWSMQKIADQLGVHYTVIYRARWGHNVPRYQTSVALVEMAQREMERYEA